jgi:hypothetical protein
VDARSNNSTGCSGAFAPLINLGQLRGLPSKRATG